jgi:hypothetical protein
MPEGVGYGPQFTASIGKTLNYIGDHAYAFSGLINVQNTDDTFLLFDTSSEYMVGHFQCYNGSNTAEQIRWDIFFNDILIIQFNQEGRGSAFRGQGADQDIVIPPFTQVKVTGLNSGSSVDVNGFVAFTGKIYK